ncbi:hypothetical protein ACGYLJ_18680, partial [Sulfitobacter sp. 1A09213]
KELDRNAVAKVKKSLAAPGASIHGTFRAEMPCRAVDNGIQFAGQPRNRNTAYSRPMRFDMICKANGIEHRLTKPNHPWTTDEIEQPLSLLSCYFPQRGRPRGTERSARCELRHAA